MSSDVSVKACLDETAVLDYLSGGLDDDAIDAHIAECGACRLLVRLAAPGRSDVTYDRGLANAATLPDASTLGPRSLGATDRLGRYEIVTLLGAGGMGVVYEARDPKLDRRIALKLWRGPSTPQAGEMLLREGRAIAKLAHPNVVAVHDVGEHDGLWYVAMELVSGGTLADWQRAAPRSTTQIVAMYSAAGRGLAAAHAGGLVHRDFKPANVLVGADERPRVSDFGIAVVDRSAVIGDAGDVSTAAGTPAYMAPEQIDGRVVDARADQFSFGVALFEALDGKRPFPGTTVPEIRKAISQGPTALPLRVPRRIAFALQRALRESPADRFPTMQELLRALAPSRARRYSLPVAGVGCALAIGIVGTRIAQDRVAPPCADLDRPLAGIWDPVRTVELTRAFAATRASETGRSTSTALGRYADRWLVSRTETCEAAQIRRELTPQQQELRFACLDERLGELRAVTDILVVPDRDAITNAPTMLASLTPPQACDDMVTLSERLPPPSPSARGEVDGLRGRLARIRAEVAAGRFDVAGAGLAEMRTPIRALHYRPLEAEAALVAGVLGDKQGYLAQAERELRDAVLAAEAGRDNVTAAAAWLQLVHTRARGRGDVAGAMDALAHADATVERLGADVDRSADLEYARGVALRQAGRYADARAAFDAAVALVGRSRLDRRAHLSRIELDLAGVLGSVGAKPEAIATVARALARWRETVGNDHPDLAGGLVVAAATYVSQGDLRTANASLDEAERILLATVGADHPRYAQLLMIRAHQRLLERSAHEALALIERAREVFERRYGETHSLVPALHRMAASAALDANDPARAEKELAIAGTLFERAMGPSSIEALQTREVGVWIAYNHGDGRAALGRARAHADEATQLLGGDHPVTAEAYRVLGFILATAEQYPESIASYERALASLERAGSSETSSASSYHRELGETLLDAERAADAVAPLETAVAIDAKNGATNTADGQAARYFLALAYRETKQPERSVAMLEPLVAELTSAPADDLVRHRARMWLGITLDETGGDRARAKALVADAAAELRLREPSTARIASDWLRSHR